MREGDLARGSFSQFLCYFAALNALAWSLSGEDSDKKIFTDLKKKIVSLRISQDSEAFVESLRMLERFKNTFSDGIHNLGRQRNQYTPREIPMDLPGDRQTKISEVDCGALNSDQLIWLSIGLIYQFRCNLVHGTKNPASVLNEAVVDSINRSLKCWIEIVLPHASEAAVES